MDLLEVDTRFTYYPPKDKQPEIYQLIREKAKQFGNYISVYCPDGREQSLAMTKLEEVVMWTNAGIARGGK